MTGLTSGYQSDRAGAENMSFAKSLRDKTLLIKDADTILQNPALPEIISQLRAFYDRHIRSQFKNRMSCDHENVNTTVLFCGTSSLRALDSSELGERFLDCVLMENIDNKLEDEVLNAVVRKAAGNMRIESSSKPSTNYDPAMVKVMELTGGYVEYLRSNATKLLSELRIEDESLYYCTRLGKFVAFMRARPPEDERRAETAQREFGARLSSQHVRYAMCAAVVLNKSELDEEVMQRTQQVALDTSTGKTLVISKHLYEAEEGLSVPALAMLTNSTTKRTYNYLRFLKLIGVVRTKTPMMAAGVKGKPVWHLTKRLTELWEEVHDTI
jgi:hypothetical protein